MPQSRPGTNYEVRVNGYVDPRLRLLTVDQSLGGGLAEHATLEFDFGPALAAYGSDGGADPRKAHLVDVNVAKMDLAAGGGNYVGATCEVILVPPSGTSVVEHFGRLSLSQVRINEQAEGLRLVSRFERQMFGSPVLFQRVLDPRTKDVTSLDEQICFNPEIDGVSLPNQRVPQGPTTAADVRPLFVHPDSLRTVQAAFYQGTLSIVRAVLDGASYENPAKGWTLPEAVKYLCAECNPFERYVLNPNEDGLSILDTDPSTLRHHTLRPGLYLHEALDALLNPYGYTWRIEYLAAGQRRIRCERQGSSPLPPTQVRLQRPGSNLEVENSDAASIDLDVDTGSIINQVRVIGGFTQVEATWELKPAWHDSYDSIGFIQLLKNLDGWKTNPQYHRVHRDWILNEAGDYGGMRSGLTGAYDLTAVFQRVFGPDHPAVVARRRRFLPTLTTKGGSGGTAGAGGENQPIGEHGGVTIEYWNTYKMGGAGWQTLAPSDPILGTVEVLTGECGIRFNGDYPPPLMRSMLQAGTARVRVTATIESDTRLSYVAARQPNSLAFDVAEVVLDMPQSFHLRKLCRSGTQRSIYDSSAFGATLEADGSQAMARFADLLRTHWDMADLTGTIAIEGLDRGRYKLGQCVDLVDNRGIRLNCVGDGAGGFYPQIVRRQLDMQNQREILHLATFRREVHDVLGLAQRSERNGRNRSMRRTPRTGSGVRGA